MALVGSWRVALISGNKIPVAVAPVCVMAIVIVPVLVMPVWVNTIPLFVIAVPVVSSSPVRGELLGVCVPVSIDMTLVLCISLTGGSTGVIMVAMMSPVAVDTSVVPGLGIVMSGTLRDPEDITTISGCITDGAVTPVSVNRAPGSATLTSIDPVLTILVSTVPVLDHTHTGGSRGTGDHPSIFPDAVVPVLVATGTVVSVIVIIPPVELLGVDPMELVPVFVIPVLFWAIGVSIQISSVVVRYITILSFCVPEYDSVSMIAPDRSVSVTDSYPELLSTILVVA